MSPEFGVFGSISELRTNYSELTGGCNDRSKQKDVGRDSRNAQTL